MYDDLKKPVAPSNPSATFLSRPKPPPSRLTGLANQLGANLLPILESGMLSAPLPKFGSEGLDEIQTTIATLAKLKAALTLVIPPLPPTYHQAAKAETPVVLLTGATGALGAHTLRHLMALGVSTVFCPCRAKTDADAEHRVEDSLQKRGLPSLADLRASGTEIKCFSIDVSAPRLGLDHATMLDLTERVTSVVHLAWSVNFRAPISHFSDNLASLVCILKYFPLASHTFISSIAATLAWEYAGATPEVVPHDPRVAWLGYGRSKWVAEHLCAHAFDLGVDVRVIRVGQLCGDTVHGLWNAKEATPSMIRSTAVLGCLPGRDALGQEVSWLPINEAGWAVALLGTSRSPLNGADADTFELVNLGTNRLLPFTTVLQALEEPRNFGATFTVMEHDAWVERVRAAADPMVPAAKLQGCFDFWRGNERTRHLATAKLEAGLLQALVARGGETAGAKTEVDRRLHGIDKEGISKCVAAWRKEGLVPVRREVMARL